MTDDNLLAINAVYSEHPDYWRDPLALEKMAAGWGCVVGREINDSGVFVDYADDMLAERFCHVSRQLQRVTRLEPSDYAVCMMPIATRACRRK